MRCVAHMTMMSNQRFIAEFMRAMPRPDDRKIYLLAKYVRKRRDRGCKEMERLTLTLSRDTGGTFDVRSLFVENYFNKILCFPFYYRLPEVKFCLNRKKYNNYVDVV